MGCFLCFSVLKRCFIHPGLSLTHGARLVLHLILELVGKVKEQKEAAELWYVSIIL